MLKIILIALVPLLVFFSFGSDSSKTEPATAPGEGGATGTLEKMIVASGDVTLDLNLAKLNGTSSRDKGGNSRIRFEAEKDSFFTAVSFNSELRAILPSAMTIIPRGSAKLPEKLRASYEQLVLENLPLGGPYELAIRDGKSGFTFFNIEGQEIEFAGAERSLSIKNGRILISEEFAAELGRPADAGAAVGSLSVKTTMKPIQVTEVVDGEVRSDSLPALSAPNAGSVPGPDVIVGDLSGLAEFGSSGSRVGLAVATDSCNLGIEPLNWFANPANDHPVIPQNLYRMSGGSGNNERFEQIGQSNVKHAFTALQQDLCSLGCASNPNGTRLGSGCSDPYSSSLNAGPNLGSRAWINPFTGAFPRNDSATPNNSHTGHTHDGTSHRILTEAADLATSQNPGATYFAEATYVTPHEYAWCQANHGQCNMYNNTSYRRFTVNGNASPFSFSAAAATVRSEPAINAWTGSTRAVIEPDPGNDGRGVVAYKVTNPSFGVWHYEYVVYNENLDRGIQSFSVPFAAGATLSNVGFHAPPQHPGWTGDGTSGQAGYSTTPWAQSQGGNAMTWSSETLAQNPNANAIRWGTLYNFRFDSNRPPGAVQATVGFYKTGAPITVTVQGPTGAPPTPTPTPTPNLSICTPTLTVTEVSPGSLSSFEAITAGQNAVTVDAANTGLGLHGLTLVSATNANVNIPSFTFGTNSPVTATFTIPSPGQAVDFTLRASSRVNAILIRAQCSGGPSPTPTPTPTPVPPTPTPTPVPPTPTPTPVPPTPTPTPVPPTPTPTPGSPTCTPTLTVTEVFPGSAAAFEAITAGNGSVTVDHANTGLGLQNISLVSATNANVNIPAFPFGTTSPVTVTFTRPNPGQAVDFTIRASARVNAVLIRAQCSGSGVAKTLVPDVSIWLPQQASAGLDGFLGGLIFSLVADRDEVGRG